VDGRAKPGHDVFGGVAMMASVDLEKLKAVVCRLIDEIAFQAGGIEFELPEDDLYWKIDPYLKRDGSTVPEVTFIGHLKDDWDRIKYFADAPGQIPTHQLTEAAELLAYLGEASAMLPFRRREQENP
jgi:hypothetical protein